MSQPKNEAQADRPKSRLEQLHAEVEESLRLAEQVGDLKAQIKGLDRELEAKREHLDKIIDRINQGQSEYERSKARHLDEAQQWANKTTEAQRGVDELEDTRRALQAEIDNANQFMANADKELHQQLAGIEELKQGHKNLLIKLDTEKKQLETQITQTRMELNKIIQELERQAHTKEQLQAQLEDEQVKLTQLKEQYATKAKEYKLDLDALEIEISNKRNLFASWQSNMDKREHEAKTLEESLRIQQAAIMSANRDLEAAKRKFDSDKAVVGL